MNILEIYTPGLGTFVRYKVLDPDVVDEFAENNSLLDNDEYMKETIEFVVYNLRSDVKDAIAKMETERAQSYLNSIYHGCVMLNPGIDIDRWLTIAFDSVDSQAFTTSDDDEATKESVKKKAKKSEEEPEKERRRITRAKFKGLEPHLRQNIVGQNEAISAVVNALRRSIVGLGDEERPLGVFLFLGASGVGKTEMARQLHYYLFGDESEMVRIDMGEYQLKHENQKLIGSPPGYVGHDEGGSLTNQMRASSHRVVLLDEVEKAHPDIWDTFMRVFDEGMITDNSGNEISFRDSIIIMTSNLGNKKAASDLTDGGMGFNSMLDVDISSASSPPRARVERTAKEAMRKFFRPELLNRIDQTVVFNYLEKEQMRDIARLEVAKVAAKLKKKGMSLLYSDTVLDKMVEDGTNPLEGARGLLKERRQKVEGTLSEVLLSSTRWPRGTILNMNVINDEYTVDVKKPEKKKEEEG